MTTISPVQFSARPQIGVEEAKRMLSKLGFSEGKKLKNGNTKYVSGDQHVIVPPKGKLSGSQSTTLRWAYQDAKRDAEARGVNFFA